MRKRYNRIRTRSFRNRRRTVNFAQTRQGRKMRKQNTALKVCLCIALAGIIGLGAFMIYNHVTAIPDTPKQEITGTVTPGGTSDVGGTSNNLSYSHIDFVTGEVIINGEV